jgi:hypothetical protein
MIPESIEITFNGQVERFERDLLNGAQFILCRLEHGCTPRDIAERMAATANGETIDPYSIDLDTAAAVIWLARLQAGKPVSMAQLAPLVTYPSLMPDG